uniref:Uncharacterized protein n=1 Tax=Marseillevirus LCMAC101 TaxID=2506602 RepID=A0A481YRR7_9VIRU|nr:MAG: hypothetical protein LCMAC101_02120 [Marseillevirus LCMAC101]
MAAVILILWYRCPTEDYQDLPGRPDSQKFLAPAPVLDSNNPSTFCALPSNIITKWGCNYDTTIYNVSDVHFRLSYTETDGPEIFIKSNINSDTDGLTISIGNGADYHYSYEYNLNDISPDSYTLKIESFIPNVPEATVRHCKTCTQDLTLYLAGYPISTSSFKYDRDPPVYAVNDIMTLTWDAPDPGDVSPPPSFFYNYYIDSGETPFISCGTLKTNLAITLKSDEITSCSANKATLNLPPGTYGMSVSSGVKECQNSHRKMSQAPNFTVVECLGPNDCSDGFICDLDNKCVNSSISSPDLSVETGEDYCSNSNDFQVIWTTDCNTYTGLALCPSNFDYSVSVYNGDPNLEFFFDNINIDSGNVCDANQPKYCGSLSQSQTGDQTYTYTFTINPMLPVGTYNKTVSMFLRGNGESNEETDNTATDTVSVKGEGTSCGSNGYCNNGECDPLLQ